MAEYDDMVNNWGCQYINIGKAGSGSKHKFDELIRSTIPGFTLSDIYTNRTSANQAAITFCTDGDLSSVLVAMGSYVAGDGAKYQALPTSGYSVEMHLCIPTSPLKSSEAAKKNTVPFPYFIPSTFNDKTELTKLESDCLTAIQLKIVMARLNGKPFRVLLMELMLGGCGAELSHNFLIKLAEILKKIILLLFVDEIMTVEEGLDQGSLCYNRPLRSLFKWSNM